MPRIDQQEGETLEFKRQWTDRALEDLAALANTRGGTLLVGIRDDGEIVGTTVDDREVQRITNLIASHLGVTPSIQVVDMKGRPVIEIQVEPAAGLVSYGGRYLRRVGTTNRDYSPDELARHILERSGRITNEQYQKIAGVSKPTATRDLEMLVSEGLLEKVGTTGRGVYYVLRARKGLKGLTNGSETAQRDTKGASKGQNDVDR